MEIKYVAPENYNELAQIYKQGVATGIATFQDDVPTWEEWDKSHLPHSRLAAFNNDEMAGWAALTPVSGRCVYAGVSEVSIYIGTKFRGIGVGRQLLEALILESENNEIWTLQSGIFQENIASTKLHEQCGFRIVGIREKIGQKNGIWKNTILMERRSRIVGN